MASGRQRAFDKQEVLDKATKVFWKKGYVGASLSDLTKNMGINKPSMYAAFGNKEQLFIQATDHYVESYLSHQLQFLQQPNKNTKQQLRDYLSSVIDLLTAEDTPKGCYLSLCIAESASEDWPEMAQATIDDMKGLAQKVLTEFFIRQNKAGDFDQDPAIIAQFIVTVMHGLAAMARADKNKIELMQVVDVTLSGF